MRKGSSVIHGFKKEIAAVLVAAVLLTLGTVLYLVLRDGSLDLYYPTESDNGGDRVVVNIDDPSVARLREIRVRRRYVRVILDREGEGETHLSVRVGNDTHRLSVRATAMNTLTDLSNRNFSGWPALVAALSLFCLISSFVFLAGYIRERKQDLFTYIAVAKLSLHIFLLLFGLSGTVLMILYAFRPLTYTMQSLLSAASNFMILAAFLSVPFTLLFAAALCVSNIQLIRREGFRFVNLLGILISLMIVVGLAAGLLFSMVAPGYLNYKWRTMILNSYYSVYMLFVCMLFAVFLIFAHITRRTPSYDKDCIVILGCAIRDDGTLYPLIRGRVDKAIEFAKAQEAATGLVPVFIPSGGKGDDEIISEAEAMKNYLLSQRIPEERILPETRSTNTIENMRFSREIAESYRPGAKAVFSTTNYHVFRSGILAREAGWDPDGIGSKTKWYFWPNALIREFIGLVVRGIGGILIMIVLTVLVSSLISAAALI